MLFFGTKVNSGELPKNVKILQRSQANNMEGLFKIDKINGKGYGWIALQDIKAGTVIYQEKNQIVLGSKTEDHLLDMMTSFYAMTENDQKQFLELHNKYLDLNSLPDSQKKWYFDIKNNAEVIQTIQKLGLDFNLALKIICIYKTNAFKWGVGIKVSRMNHSCCPNSQTENWNGCDMAIRAIRATSKILEGQEITICYLDPLKNFKERQEFCHMRGFVCSCEVCQDEEINKDDKTYEKFQNLKEEVESIIKQPSNPGFPLLEKALAHQKQMYNLAKKKKVPKSFIYDILKKALEIGFSGYCVAFNQKNHGKMKYFKGECQNLSKVGLQIAKMVLGQENTRLKEWKEITQDFDNWIKKKI